MSGRRSAARGEAADDTDETAVVVMIEVAPPRSRSSSQRSLQTMSTRPSVATSPPRLETLSIEVDGEIGTLTLNRPESLNAMSPELISELTEAAAWLADVAQLRGLVVTGSGERAFSSDRKSTRLNSSHRCISYAVFCLK